ncbi:hypothetical protein ABEZ59_18070 [Peribacillus simplex]
MVKRSMGLKKIRALKEAANRSIGIRQGAAMAKLELRALLEKYDFIQMKFEELDHQLDQLLDHIPIRKAQRSDQDYQTGTKEMEGSLIPGSYDTGGKEQGF